jgi:hypothetical protein
VREISAARFTPPLRENLAPHLKRGEARRTAERKEPPQNAHLADVSALQTPRICSRCANFSTPSRRISQHSVSANVHFAAATIPYQAKRRARREPQRSCHANRLGGADERPSFPDASYDFCASARSHVHRSVAFSPPPNLFGGAGDSALVQNRHPTEQARRRCVPRDLCVFTGHALCARGS